MLEEISKFTSYNKNLTPGNCSGDQLAIAKETGRRLGMGTNMYPSSSLLGDSKEEAHSAVPIDELIEKADGFAGVFPGMYLLIIDKPFILNFLCARLDSS